MKICGRVCSGAGRGAFFTQVDWVVRQLEDKLGYRPFPGTLNVQVCDSDLEALEALLSSADVSLFPQDPRSCDARIRKVLVNHISAAMVVPSEKGRIHEIRIVEIIAPQNVRQVLCLEDGDTVTLSDAEMGDDGLQSVFDFAASAGAFEGYVYRKGHLNPGDLDNWIENLVRQYGAFPQDVRSRIQASVDRTVGRAVQSLTALFGKDHAHVRTLMSLTKGALPVSPDDFDQEIAEKAQR